MQIQYSYRAIDKEFHEPWQRALGNVIERDLKPLLDKHTKDSVRLQIVLDRDKIKRQWGHVKVRYRGLAKNTAQLHTLFALSNLWMVRRTLLQEMRG